MVILVQQIVIWCSELTITNAFSDIINKICDWRMRKSMNIIIIAMIVRMTGKILIELLQSYAQERSSVEMIEYDSGASLCEDESCITEVPACVFGHQYGRYGRSESCHENKGRVSQTSRCSGYCIHELCVGWI